MQDVCKDGGGELVQLQTTADRGFVIPICFADVLYG